jgi:hypothetical protein
MELMCGTFVQEDDGADCLIRNKNSISHPVSFVLNKRSFSRMIVLEECLFETLAEKQCKTRTAAYPLSFMRNDRFFINDRSQE